MTSQFEKLNIKVVQGVDWVNQRTTFGDQELLNTFRRLFIDIVIPAWPFAVVVDTPKQTEKLHQAGMSDSQINMLRVIQFIADHSLPNIFILAALPLAGNLGVDVSIDYHGAGLMTTITHGAAHLSGAWLIGRAVYGGSMELVRDLFYWFVVPGLIHRNEELSSFDN